MKRGVALVCGMALAACGPQHGMAREPGALPTPPADASTDADDAAQQEERLAAIQKAMNELDDASQQCWAAAATQRFDIEGDVDMQITIERGSATAVPVRDTTRNPALQACLVTLFDHYAWAPPLFGQTIRLPFRFRAPDGQSVIDRALVKWSGQAGTAVAVLLDEANTGNAAASMFELALDQHAQTGERIAARAELWYFLAPARVTGFGGASATLLKAGDLVAVPAGGVRNVIAAAGPLHAVVIVAPGAIEGSGRAGALPTALASGAGTAGGPVIIGPAALGWHDARFDVAVVKVPARTTITGQPSGSQTHLLYLLAGTGALALGATTVPLSRTSVVQIPPTTTYTLTASEPIEALRVTVLSAL